MLDIKSLFDTLEIPLATSSDGLRFAAQPIPGYESHRLGRDAQGAPSLLIAVAENTERPRPAPIVLEHLTVQSDVRCRIAFPTGELEEGLFTVAQCVRGDQALHEYFLHVGGTMIEVLGGKPAQARVTQVISQLAELFRAMSSPSKKSVQGLWAELFLISRAYDAVTSVMAWHLNPEDRYDLSAGDQRVEVKSAIGRVRQHYFSLEQLRPPMGTTLLIASMFVERTGAGLSVLELANQIRARVSNNPDALLRIDQVIGLTLGENWRYASEERFDQALAQTSLTFFEAEVVPALEWDIPPGISEVRFKADLTGKPPANLRDYRAKGGLYQAIIR